MSSRIERKFDFDFLSKKNLCISISAIVVFLSIGSLGTQGLQLGTDFSGGASVNVENFLVLLKPSRLERCS